MKNKNKFRKIFSLAILTLLIAVNLASAQVNATWYTKSLNVQVGDTIKIDLYINPRADHPVVTVSNSLNYNKDKLKFSNSYFPDGWISITKSPEFATDEENGFLRRTAGYPNGISNSSKYMTYEFVATEVGQAEISIDEGTVLDQESTNLGLQKKKMVINIVPKVEIATSSIDIDTQGMAEVVPLVLEPVVNTVNLNIYGKIAIKEGEDYTFKFLKDTGANKDKSSTVNISVLDAQGSEVYTYRKFFAKHGPSSLEFVVPYIVLTEGEYTIQIRNKFEGSNDVYFEEKQIAVVSSDKDWVDKNRNQIFTVFAIIIVIAVLYHIHRDHQIFRKLRRRKISVR